MARVPTGGTVLTAGEQLVVQSLTDDSYFVDPYTPSGTVNGTNDIFTLPSTPDPASSLIVYVDGQFLTLTEDYTVSGTTLTFVSPPYSGSLIRCTHRLNPA